VWHLVPLQAGHVPVFREFAGCFVHWDMGLQDNDKYSNVVIMKDATVNIRDDVQAMLLVRDITQEQVFAAATFHVRDMVIDGKVMATW